MEPRVVFMSQFLVERSTKQADSIVSQHEAALVAEMLKAAEALEAKAKQLRSAAECLLVKTEGGCA